MTNKMEDLMFTLGALDAAAREWRDARKDLLAHKTNDPGELARVNRLAEAEDRLYKAAHVLK